MNFIIFIMLVFFLIGLLDKTLNNKFNVAEAFDEGLKNFGSITLSMSGFYCIMIFFLLENMDTFLSLTSYLPIDSSFLIGSILAPDMGGFSIVHSISDNISIVVFSGILLTSTIGATISFQLPIFFGSIEKCDLPYMVHGLIYGLITLPFILFVAGIYLQVPDLLLNLLPMIILCVLLYIGLTKFYQQTISILSIFANMIKFAGMIFFGMVATQVLFPNIHFTSDILISEAMMIVLKMGIIVCGSLVLSEFILRYGKKQIQWIANKIGCNEISVVGFILSLTTSLAMLPLFSKMDNKGKILNGAFSVSGAYVIGGQLGFINSVTTQNYVLLYMIVKLCAGIFAMLIASLYDKKSVKEC